MIISRKRTLGASFSALALAVAMIASTPVLAPKAQAQIPMTDIANLTQAIQDNIMRAIEWAKDEAMQLAQMDMMELFSQLEIDNVNNGFANMIARMGRSSQEIQNLEQLEKSMPAQDTCSTVVLSTNLEDQLCNMESQVQAENNERAGYREISAGRGTLDCSGNSCKFVAGKAPSTNDISNLNAIESKKIVDTCNSLVDASGNSLCTVGSLMINPPPQGLLADEYKAAKLQIRLAANPIMKTPKADSRIEKLKGTPAHDKALVDDQRRTYFKESLIAGQDNYLMLTQGTLEAGDVRKPGDIHNLENYLSKRLGSQNWMCEVTNTCAQAAAEGNYVSPDELEKRKIQMDAVMMYISLQQYKSSLRIEKYLADMAMIQLEPVD